MTHTRTQPWLGVSLTRRGPGRRCPQFCVLKNVIPRNEVPAVREGILRAAAAHRQANAALTEGHPMAVPQATARSVEEGLSAIQQRLTDPATTRTEAIAMVDGLAQTLRATGITALSEPGESPTAC